MHQISITQATNSYTPRPCKARTLKLVLLKTATPHGARHVNGTSIINNMAEKDSDSENNEQRFLILLFSKTPGGTSGTADK